MTLMWHQLGIMMTSTHQNTFFIFNYYGPLFQHLAIYLSIWVSLSLSGYDQELKFVFLFVLVVGSVSLQRKPYLSGHKVKRSLSDISDGRLRSCCYRLAFARAMVLG